jgi:hypothetical protein
MSFETSTDTLEGRGGRLPPSREASADHRSLGVGGQPAHGSSDTLEPWQLFTLAGLIGATIVVFVSTGQTPAGIILLSLTIFTAAVVGVAAWRTLSPLIGSDEPIGAPVLGGRTRAVLEREKALALRSIKELEFDHSMGKVSDKDFAEMRTRLRVRAAGLIRQLDAGSAYRDQIEQEIARRVGQKPVKSGADLPDRRSSGSEGGYAPPGGSASVEGSVPHTNQPCPKCSQENDSDAKFCKNCGSKLEGMS